MKNKIDSRLRRAKKTRHKIHRLNVTRMSVYRTPRHIYAQIIAPQGGQVLASASTLDPEVKTELAKDKLATGNVAAAKVVGKVIAQRAKKAGVDKLAFDRSGFRYHGRIKALADAAREGGIQI